MITHADLARRFDGNTLDHLAQVGPASKPRGRPRGRRHDYALTTRLPAPMYDALCHLAALKRLSVSATVRRLIAYQLEHPRAF